MTELEQARIERDLCDKMLHCGIPEYMQGAFVRYIWNGIEPGSFAAAVLSNDLLDACHRADGVNKHLLFNYCQFMYNHLPIDSYGSPETYHAWVKAGGLRDKTCDMQHTP